MDKQNRRDLIREFKESKPAAGVFAVRCVASGGVWVGGAPNVAAQQNRLWFALRSGGHPNAEMQANWATHGAESFTFDVLEQVEDPELTPAGLKDELKSRERHWLAALDAKRAVG